MVLFELIGICICVCVIYYYIYTNSIERNYKFSTPFKIPLIGNPYILFLYRNKGKYLQKKICTYVCVVINDYLTSFM